MKKLIGWNGYYGFMPFEICIAYGETLEEKKAYYESIGYKCWVEDVVLPVIDEDVLKETTNLTYKTLKEEIMKKYDEDIKQN